jgi:cytochrome c-type biogenesis protein CcmH
VILSSNSVVAERPVTARPNPVTAGPTNPVAAEPGNAVVAEGNPVMAGPRPGHRDPHQCANDAVPVSNHPAGTARTPRPPRSATVRLASAVLLCSVIALPAHAVSDPAELLPNRAQELRAEAIGDQLRCLVCQNESIEQSDADLARDLRRIIRQRVVAGDGDQQIIDWMVARYGNFVRLRPPLDAMTLLLWGAPGIALLAGLAAAVIAWRRRPAEPAPLSDDERERLANLLKS